MRRAFLVCGIMAFCICNTSIAYAESLNAYENEVISAARGEFEVDKKLYKVGEAYIQQLIDYLNTEGVDLTQEQKEQAIAGMNLHVEEGVEQGYLLPKDEHGSAFDSVQENTSDTTEQEPSGQDDDQETGADHEDGDTEQEAEMTQADDKAEVSDSSDRQVQKPEKASNTGAVDQKAENTGEVTGVASDDTEEEDLLVKDTIIKNTGFNLNSTVFIALGAVLLMIICMIDTIKSNLFAHNDE